GLRGGGLRTLRRQYVFHSDGTVDQDRSARWLLEIDRKDSGGFSSPDLGEFSGESGSGDDRQHHRGLTHGRRRLLVRVPPQDVDVPTPRLTACEPPRSQSVSSRCCRPVRCRVSSTFDSRERAASAALNEAVDVLLFFGASMLRAGNTATRTREWIEVIARKMGLDAVAVSLSLDSITASARRDGEWTTTMREIGPPGINALRIAELEQLAKTAAPGLAPREIAAKLSEIESTAPRYSSVLIAAAVGVASGGFAFLNGAAVPELIAATIGGGVGQCLR